MKKLISIVLAAMLALSLSVTAFAATNDEAPSATETQIKEAVVKQFFEESYPFVTVDDIEIIYHGTASDGGIYFSYFAYGFATPDVFLENTIGDYYYDYNAGDAVYLYKDNLIYEIKDAYEDGIINDSILAEISAMDCGVYPKIGESGMDSRVEWDLKYYLYNIYFENEPAISADKIESIQIHYYGTTSDGNMYLSYTIPGIEQSDEILKYNIGEYVYNVKESDQVYYYHVNQHGADTLCTIKEAYDNGLIDDSMLKEVSALNFGLVNANDVTEPKVTEPSTLPQTINTDATSSKSVATTDTPANLNSNGAVQTGQNSFAVLTLFIVLTFAGAAFIFFRCAYRK